jgi:hypothetical protein
MEEWRDIEGYNELYKISDAGNVMRDGRLRKLRPNKRGYVRINLSKDGKIKVYMVHRLVAIAFLPNPENKPQVNHKNGIRSDNRLVNLEWCSQSENQLHAFKNELQIGNNGQSNGHAKLTNEDVINIRKNFNGDYKDFANKYSVSQESIRRVINYVTFKQFIYESN